MINNFDLANLRHELLTAASTMLNQTWVVFFSSYYALNDFFILLWYCNLKLIHHSQFINALTWNRLKAAIIEWNIHLQKLKIVRKFAPAGLYYESNLTFSLLYKITERNQKFIVSYFIWPKPRANYRRRLYYSSFTNRQHTSIIVSTHTS